MDSDSHQASATQHTHIHSTFSDLCKTSVSMSSFSKLNPVCTDSQDNALSQNAPHKTLESFGKPEINTPEHDDLFKPWCFIMSTICGKLGGVNTLWSSSVVESMIAFQRDPAGFWCHLALMEGEREDEWLQRNSPCAASLYSCQSQTGKSNKYLACSVSVDSVFFKSDVEEVKKYINTLWFPETVESHRCVSTRMAVTTGYLF